MTRPPFVSLFTLLTLVGLAGPGVAAEFTVDVGGAAGNVFTPANLTISVGDTVTWRNLGGLHNVVADNGEFSSGGPSTAAWTFSFTFTDPGQVLYFCEIHGAAGGVGMAGAITVQADDDGGSEDEAGRIRFENGSLQVLEGAGTLTVTVQRSMGDDGAVSVDYSTSDGSAEAGGDYEATSGTLSWGDGDDISKSFEIPIFDDGSVEGSENFGVRLSSPSGGATLGNPSQATVTIQDDDQDSGPCVPDDFTLCLNREGRFEARLEFRLPGQESSSQARKFDTGLRDSGLFYFNNPDNSEMLIKVINGCPVAGLEAFWVFYAATTNVEFTLRVRDTETGDVRMYPNPLGRPAPPVQDTGAFPNCP